MTIHLFLPAPKRQKWSCSSGQRQRGVKGDEAGDTQGGIFILDSCCSLLDMTSAWKIVFVFSSLYVAEILPQLTVAVKDLHGFKSN